MTNYMEVLGWKEEQLNQTRFIGFSFLRQGHYKKAALYFEALLTLSPDQPYDLQTLGALYLQLGENEKALSFLDTALRLTPDHAPSILNKTKALLLLGRRDEAFVLARQLEKNADRRIADDASALLLAYA